MHADRTLRFATAGGCSGLWDRTRLTQVVSNLVSNALKHGQRNEPVDVVVRADGDAVVFTIHNGGPPIPPAILPVVFEPFSHGPEGGQRGEPGEASIGLGLYVTHEIVAAHGGDIEVSSSSAEGTTFTVRLPRALPTVAATVLPA
jgi:signal transduction histidine kinase